MPDARLAGEASDAPRGRVHLADGVEVARSLEDGSVDLVYLDPPFNTGRRQRREQLRTTRAAEGETGDRTGFGGERYRSVRLGSRSFADAFDDYLAFLEPFLTEAHRLLAPSGSLYLHLDYREVHYVKVLLDQLFGRENFVNEIIWAYDFGGRPKNRWPAKHDNILFYAKDAARNAFYGDDIERIPYMAPGLAGPREGRPRQAADRHLVAHDREPDRQGEARLPDAEAARRARANRAGVLAARRARRRPRRRLRHHRRGGAAPRPPLRARRPLARGIRRHAPPVRRLRGRRVRRGRRKGRGVTSDITTQESPPTEELLRFALEMADAADAVSMHVYRTDHAIERKSDGSFVTPADHEVEELLRARIAEAYPSHVVLGEEQGGADVQGDDPDMVRWIIDPIDGTHNYMRGIPVWATLIACERGGTVEVGVTSAPALGTRWWAGRGLGAYRGACGIAGRGAGERIHVSEVSSIPEAHVLLGELTTTLDHWPGAGALLRECWRERGLGDFWGYCLVAEGAGDVMLEGYPIATWDMASAIPIVEEAGGRMTDIDGRTTTEPGPRIATNGRLHDEVLRRLRGS